MVKFISLCYILSMVSSYEHCHLSKLLSLLLVNTINMAPKRVSKSSYLDYKKLTVNDVLCPLCRSILIRPITLPCNHGFCEICFQEQAENPNCPICSIRVGSWLRSARNSNKLVNETLWNAIQVNFPTETQKKLVEKSSSTNTQKNMDGKIPVTRSRQNVTNNKLNAKTLSIPPTTSETKSDKTNSSIINLAIKEYTCRILCQNSKVSTNTSNESLIRKKNKQIQKLTECHKIESRSDSIESECLYFKPIDYRNNPKSEGLAPIKVPTKKPNLSPNTKIVAPCGQNKIIFCNNESAFVRLSSRDEAHQIESESVNSVLKRKNDKSDNKSKKKVKNAKNCKAQDSDIEKNNSSLQYDKDNHTNNNINNVTTIKKHISNLLDEEKIKKTLQEQSDFELALKLQEQFNQAAKYVTRSMVPKRAATKRQVKLEGMMAPYKVK